MEQRSSCKGAVLLFAATLKRAFLFSFLIDFVSGLQVAVAVQLVGCSSFATGHFYSTSCVHACSRIQWDNYL